MSVLPVAHRARRAWPLRRCLEAALPAVVAALLLPGALVAQLGGEWPTLRDLGIEYISRSGGFQVSFSGQLDAEAMHVTDSWSSLVSLEGGTDVLRSVPEDCSVCHGDQTLTSVGGGVATHRLRLFVDIFLGDHVYSLVEVRTDHGASPTSGKARARVDQAYVRAGNTPGTWGVQLGRFASPFGSYSLRHLTVVDPFLRPPLGYDYRTLMSRTVGPPDAEALLGWRETPDEFRRPGAPPVWDVPYQWGGMAFGRLLGVDLRVAAMNSAPSSAPDAWAWDVDRLANPSWVVSARRRLTRDLEVGLSWSKGPWLEELSSGLPAPSEPGGDPPSRWDYDQELLAADVDFARGATMVRAEVMLDRWEVPNVPVRPSELIYNLEVQRDLTPGLFAAARVGHIDFRPLVVGEAGRDLDWDDDVTRFEASLGYRLARNSGVLLSAWDQTQARGSTDARLVGLRLWWAF